MVKSGRDISSYTRSNWVKFVPVFEFFISIENVDGWCRGSTKWCFVESRVLFNVAVHQLSARGRATRSTIECTACERSWLPNEQLLLTKGRHAIGNCHTSYEISCTPTNRLSIDPLTRPGQCAVTKHLRWHPAHAVRYASLRDATKLNKCV
jgi:hypothetical protein